jgi:AraC-like DNA-binding protein
MDVLTDLLRGVRSRNQIYGRLELSAPWGIRVEGTSRFAFYAVSRGSAYLSHGKTTVHLVAGDIVFVREGLPHTLKDHPRSRAASVVEVYAQRDSRCGGIVRYGGEGAHSTLVSGGFSFETTALDPLVTYLPPILHVHGDGEEAARWLETTLQFMASEMHAEAPGYELVASRLADVLFVHALRTHVRDQPCGSAMWLRAISDPQLGAAFQKMHKHPEEPWTVDTLARTASMSRSAFASRFTTTLGIAPLAYLTRWRMHRAAELLVAEPSSIANLAVRVGYGTESAFTKVFKRHFGETPSAYRRRVRSAAARPDPVDEASAP